MATITFANYLDLDQVRINLLAKLQGLSAKLLTSKDFECKIVNIFLSIRLSVNFWGVLKRTVALSH